MRTIKLPKNFLLLGSGINKVIYVLRKCLKGKNRTILLNFSKLENITKGDLMVLIAQIEKTILTLGNRVYRIGKLPQNKKAKDTLIYVQKIFHENKNTSFKKLSDSEKARLIKPTIIDSVVKDLKKIGIKEYYFPFNSFLTEIIGNAVEHGLKNKKINWWLSQDIVYSEKKVIYTFVDMGLGIINSHKKAGIPLKYMFFGDKKIIMDSLNGKLISSTKEIHRGKGLPELRQMIEAEIVSEFELITNKINLQFKNNQFVIKKNSNFVGTYYSWTISQFNINKWKDSELI